MVRILLIDDDASVREALAFAADKLGHQLIATEHGKDALRLYRETPFDVVVTDLLMPDQDGLETIRALRKAFPGVRIVAISGGGRVDPALYLQMAEQIGADFTLAKPFSAFEFDAAISAVLHMQG
jgi:CheY-like chemotaxis protein